MSVLRWEKPPAHGLAGRPKPGSKWAPVAAELRANPGEWAVIAEDVRCSSASSLSAGIRRGTGAWSPAGTFEARQVGPAGGLAKVYARFVGTPESAA